MVAHLKLKFVLLTILPLTAYCLPVAAQVTSSSAQPRYYGNRTTANEPATCSSLIGSLYYDTTDKVFKWCADTNVWEVMGGGSGLAYTTSGTNNFIPRFDGTGFVNSGISDNGSAISFAPGGVATSAFEAQSVGLRDGTKINWSSTSAPTGVKDTGFARNSAGVVRFTNGSTGYGTFLSAGNANVAIQSASNVGLTITGAASQTANLQDWKSNSATLLSVSSAGYLLGESAGRRIRLASGVSSLEYDTSNYFFANASGTTLFAANVSATWNGTQFYSTATTDTKDLGQSANIWRRVYAGKLNVAPATPASSAEACTANDMWADADYIYFCVSSGTIKRATLATF